MLIQPLQLPVSCNSFRLCFKSVQSLEVAVHVPLAIIRYTNQLAELLIKSVSNKGQRLIFARKLCVRFYAQFNASKFAQSIIIQMMLNVTSSVKICCWKLACK